MANNKMNPWAQAGMGIATGAANGAIGQGMGLIFGRMQDERQLKQQQKLTDMQIAANKEMSDYQQRQAMAMWRATNYGPQIEEAKKAGMSISALYGGSGAGGATTGGASAAGVSGGQAGDPNAGVGMGIQMASQIAMQKAQTENIQADTELKKEQAAKTGGVDTEKTTTEIANLKQGIENAKAQEALTRIQTTLTGMNAEITGRTMDEQVEAWQWGIRRIITDFHNAENETFINTNTRQEKIQIIQQEAISGLLKNALTKSEISVNTAKTKQMAEAVAQGWKGLKQGDERIAIERFKEEVKANYPSILEVIGRMGDDGLETLFKLGGYRPITKPLN